MKKVDSDIPADFAARAVKRDDGKMYWDPMDVFKLLGPNMHLALKPVLCISGDPLELFPDCSWECVMDSVVDALKDRAREVDPNITSPTAKLDFWTFFFLRPDPSGPVTSFPPDNYYVPTPFLRGLVVHGMRSIQVPRRLEMLLKLQNYGYLDGAIFEAAALAHLSDAHVKAVLPASPSLIIGARSSGPAYLVYEDKDHLLPPPANRTRPPVDCKLYAKPAPYIPDQSGFYACPPGFPGADAIILADGDADVPERYEIIVRATASKDGVKEPIIQRGIDIITQALDQHTPRKRTRLFLFVSDTVEKSKKLMDNKVSGWTVGSVTLTVHDLGVNAS